MTTDVFVNEICIPCDNPEEKANRLGMLYAITDAHDMILADIRDKDTGEVMCAYLAVDASEDGPVKLYPIAKYLEAPEVDGKTWQLWDGINGKWIDAKDTTLTQEVWMDLKFDKTEDTTVN